MQDTDRPCRLFLGALVAILACGAHEGAVSPSTDAVAAELIDESGGQGSDLAKNIDIVSVDASPDVDSADALVCPGQANMKIEVINLPGEGTSAFPLDGLLQVSKTPTGFPVVFIRLTTNCAAMAWSIDAFGYHRPAPVLLESEIEFLTRESWESMVWFTTTSIDDDCTLQSGPISMFPFLTFYKKSITKPLHYSFRARTTMAALNGWTDLPDTAPCVSISGELLPPKVSN